VSQKTAEGKFAELLDVMARLRSDNGCPWDKQQTHVSLKPCLLEETYELLDALDRDILQSGWLLGEAIIARKAAAVAVKHGAGKVVLLGFRAQHRAQTHGTFKLVFNALVNGPAGARPATSNSSQR